MDLRETPEAKEKRLFAIAEKQLKKVLRDAPAYGSIRVEFVMIDSNVSRMIYGVEIARKFHTTTEAVQ